MARSVIEGAGVKYDRVDSWEERGAGAREKVKGHGLTQGWRGTSVHTDPPPPTQGGEGGERHRCHIRHTWRHAVGSVGYSGYSGVRPRLERSGGAGVGNGAGAGSEGER